MPLSYVTKPLEDAAHALRHGTEKPRNEAAPLKVTGNLAINRNVSSGAELHVGGDLRVGGSINGAEIVCAGELEVPNGFIKGGHVSAFRGVTCQALGDADGTETELRIGFDHALIDDINARLPEIQKAFARAQEFRTLLEPMLKDSNGLSPQQKEQISDLLFRAGDARRRGHNIVIKLLGKLKESTANAGMQCVVTGTAFQKVSISFPGAKIVLESAMEGPVRFLASRGHHGVSVSALHLQNGKSQPMQRVSFEDPMQLVQSTLESLEKS